MLNGMSLLDYKLTSHFYGIKGRKFEGINVGTKVKQSLQILRLFYGLTRIIDVIPVQSSTVIFLPP
jgi:hypothetical protein